MTAALRHTALAAAGLLSLTACSGPDAGTAPRSTTSAPPSASTSASPDLAQAPLGTEEHEVRELTVAGRPVDVPAGATLSLSPDRPAFPAVLQGVCGQPRWGGLRPGARSLVRDRSGPPARRGMRPGGAGPERPGRAGPALHRRGPRPHGQRHAHPDPRRRRAGAGTCRLIERI